MDEFVDAEVGGEEGTATGLAAQVDDPGDEVDEGGHENSEQPEPEEEVDLLVEHVDHQDTLHRVAVLVTQHSDLEVAHGHSGSPSFFSCLSAETTATFPTN